MKKILDKFMGIIKGWKTVASLVFVVYALLRYYVFQDIDYPTLMLLIGIGGTTGFFGFVSHFVEWIESLKKEHHSPNPPQGNQ